MRTRLLPPCLLAVAVATGAGVAAAPAAAEKGPHGIDIRHERVTSGPHSSRVTIVTMPRPVGNRTLMPALPGGIVSAGTATTSAVSGRLGRLGTAVAINADLFEYATGQPSGLLMIDGEVYNQPQGGRPALAVDSKGTLVTSRPKATGALTLPGGRELPFQVNVRSLPDGTIFYDRGWGPSAPDGAARSLVGRLTSGRLREQDGMWNLDGSLRVRATRGGGAPIPSDEGPDALFQASGTAARELGRARPGQTLGLRYRLGPLDADALFAIGGGPVLIRDGKIVFSVASASKEFTSGQLVPPDARTAVAQLRDGSVLFYAADKGGGSTGLTIDEVAKDLHERGAVTAMSFDSGGSTSVSIDGRLLNQPSDGVERAVGNQLVYFVGDRKHDEPVGEITVGRRAPGARVPALSYTMVRAAPVAVTLFSPKGEVVPVTARRVSAGVHHIQLPADLRLRNGRWRVKVVALGASKHVDATFVVTPKPQPAVTKPTNAPAGSDPAAAMPAPATKPAATSGGDSSTALPWILGGGALALLAAGAAVLMARRRPR